MTPCAVISGYGYACTRDRGHTGAHVATDPKNRVLDTWGPDTWGPDTAKAKQ